MKVILFIPALLLVVNLGAQKSSFSVDHINNEVLLSISIHSGNFCNGIKILRSKDSINFEEIGYIGGYCGNLNETVTYTFSDTDPILNQTSYYKAELVGLTTTAIRSVFVLDFGGDDFKLSANPITTTATLYFKNAPNSEVTLTIYDLEGKAVRRQVGSGSYFEINANDYVDGVYIFSVTTAGGKKVASGKLFIAKV